MHLNQTKLNNEFLFEKGKTIMLGVMIEPYDKVAKVFGISSVFYKRCNSCGNGVLIIRGYFPFVPLDITFDGKINHLGDVILMHKTWKSTSNTSYWTATEPGKECMLFAVDVLVDELEANYIEDFTVTPANMPVPPGYKCFGIGALEYQTGGFIQFGEIQFIGKELDWKSLVILS